MIASPSATPGARLNESVTAGNWLWWFTASAAVVGANRAIAPSGTSGPPRDGMYTAFSVSGLCQNRGATSITTWYWFSCVYIVDTCRWPKAS